MAFFSHPKLLTQYVIFAMSIKSFLYPLIMSVKVNSTISTKKETGNILVLFYTSNILHRFITVADGNAACAHFL